MYSYSMAIQLLIIVVLVALFPPPCASATVSQPINVGLLVPESDRYLFSYRRVLPAINAGQNVVAFRNLLNGYTLNFLFNDTKCDQTFGPLSAIDAHTNSHAQAFIGPVCDYAVAPVVRFSKIWNTPVISPGATASAFDDKQKYPLLTRVGPVNNQDLAQMMLRLLQFHNWKKVKLIYEENPNSSISKRFCFQQTEALYTGLRPHDIEVKYFKIHGQNPESVLLNGVGHDFGVVVLCASPHTVREIMIKAHDLNFDNGEYVFFNIDLSPRGQGLLPWYNETDTEARNRKAAKAYGALLTVTLRLPNTHDYKAFSRDIKGRAREMFMNSPYGEEEVSSFVAAFHDAVYLYALALNESLAANVSVSNGSEITRRMWNRTFLGISGLVSINANGDRNADYSLLGINPTTKKFEVLGNFIGYTKIYYPVNGRSIHWAGGKQTPPPDTPICSYDGSKCRQNKDSESESETESGQMKEESPKFSAESELKTLLGRLVKLHVAGQPQPYWVLGMADQERNDLMARMNMTESAYYNESADVETLSVSDRLAKLEVAVFSSNLVSNNNDKPEDPYTMFHSSFNDSELVPTKGMVLAFPATIATKGSGFDSKTGVFTSPSNGIYRFDLTITSEGSGRAAIIIEARGRCITTLTTGTSGREQQTSVGSVIDLEAGDEVKVIVVDVVGRLSLKGRGYSTFTGYILRSI